MTHARMGKDQARRVAEATRRVERYWRNQPQPPEGGRLNLGAVLCLTTSTISARSGTSPNFTLGRGTGRLLAIGLDGSLTATTSSTATTTTAGRVSGPSPPGYFPPGYFPPGYSGGDSPPFSNPVPDVNLYHGGTATIASGRLVQCKWVGPVLVVDVDYCP